MKTIVSVQEIEELEVKPPAEVARWRELVAAEFARRAAEAKDWIVAECPCCDAATATSAFERSGVDYVECGQCHTLYARRRPGEQALAEWYRESVSAQFWRERLLAVSEQARREKIVLPRAQWVQDGIAEYVTPVTRLVDVSSNSGPLLAELHALVPNLGITAAGMTADLDSSSARGITTRPSETAELKAFGPVDVVTAFDVFDRAADLRSLVRAIHDTLRTGGIVFATLPVSSGFEVQALWERSRTVQPPDKVNLPTIDGLKRLFATPRWELLELSTPGMFDVELVQRAVEEFPDAPWPRVVRALVSGTSAAGRAALTEYLQSQRLTSFARLVARRSD